MALIHLYFPEYGGQASCPAKIRRAAILISAVLIAASSTRPVVAQVGGIDHIPIVVADLDSAAATYSRLGFSLKPGRAHDNGIRNRHVKFPDGTELELITADSAADELTREYLRLLAAGEGAAFLALYTTDANQLKRNLDAAGIERNSGGYGVSFPSDSPIRFIFFGGRNHSPTDRPEHFAHPNGATSLAGVWLALSDSVSFAELGDAIGLPRPVSFPPESTIVLEKGFIRLVPERRQIIAGRPITGATLCVADLNATRAFLSRALGRQFSPPSPNGDQLNRETQSALLAPTNTHGLWLEFTECND